MGNLGKINIPSWIEHFLTAGLIIALSYWFFKLFTQVFIYYLKDYTQQTEVMWDDVLLPLLEAVVPIIIFTIGGVFFLKSFGVDLTGIWVTLGGATFVLFFAAQDILANFFSGVVLLIDTPFQFGDVLRKMVPLAYYAKSVFVSLNYICLVSIVMFIFPIVSYRDKTSQILVVPHLIIIIQSP